MTKPLPAELLKRRPNAHPLPQPLPAVNQWWHTPDGDWRYIYRVDKNGDLFWKKPNAVRSFLTTPTHFYRWIRNHNAHHVADVKEFFK